MRIHARLLPVAIAMFFLMGGEAPSIATADPCIGCTTNSPILNPFPVGGLRWGTSRVVEGATNCSIENVVEPAIAIKKLPDIKESKLRGYQLVVVDSKNKQICQGLDLVGVTFRLNPHWEAVVIRQVAKTEVTKDPFQIDAKSRNEDRLMYYISTISNQDDSICTNYRPGSNGWGQRLRRRIFGTRRAGLSDSDLMQPSKDLANLFNVFQDRLAEYVVVIPDAAYDYDGSPADLTERWKNEKLRSIGEASKLGLEWFELACAGGALAHTDLSGLVEVGESKKVRTAALRMFMANYRDDEGNTLPGTPIQYTRNEAYPSCPSCSNQDLAARESSIQGEVEARWNEEGAMCLSHSRLWLKDTIITIAKAYKGKTLEDREAAFTSQFKLPPCTKQITGYFTTYALNHIVHDKTAKEGLTRVQQWVNHVMTWPTHQSPSAKGFHQ